MPVSILRASWALTHLFSPQPHGISTVIIFNLQRRKLKLIEAREICPL